MTTGVPEALFQHDLVLHDGATALVDLMVPFVLDGADLGDRVVLVGEPAFVDVMLTAVPGVPGIVAVPRSGRARFPGRDLRQFQRVLSTLGEGPRLRVVNQMPRMAPDAWHEWRRYEAAANRLLAQHRVWSTCAYATDGLDAGMLQDLATSHPHVLTAGGRERSERFARLDVHIGTYLDVPRHPIEATAPQLSLTNPTAVAARRAIREPGTAISLPAAAIDAAVLAVSETVTNSSLHGQRPARLQAWTRDGRLTISVTDAGAGPHPLVGLVPAPVDEGSGRGMWILLQMLADIRHRTDRHGYTVRFSVGHDMVALAPGGPQASAAGDRAVRS
ncbi:hypothetical protein N866_05075 [Actinotalea ferrariae CF5-4]|uniref:Sensor histidine kinase n=1 Tax=Actinotalea ferrariae CF5-4 TaxID=948458 RepID=A0A021VNP5_9CELL|nr:MEDS domain-containing protein [Actinotalea ferrariae]EYR62804.1 hypothetical protein N866_05075 [Actinotalea ferrariae CF5-4]